MKTWSLLYLVIWTCFLEILLVFYPVAGGLPIFDLHSLLGVVVLVLAYFVYLQVGRTDCPDRIKRITKTTAYLAVVQGVLGVLLYAASWLNIGGLLPDFAAFVHLVLAIAIITQASSSATAYDMWEEREFAPTTTSPVQASD